MADAENHPSPVVTVLISVYNCQEYILEALKSVLNQTFTDFELLIINDGSTDKSLEIINELASSDGRFRIVSRENRGLTSTLNEGIAIARGEYLARMDADDIAMPDRLAKQVAYLRSHRDCVLVGSRVMLIDPQGLPIREICTEQTHEEMDASLMNQGWPLVHPAVTMRTAVLRKIGGYCERYRTNQDHDLFLRMAENGTLANLPQTLLQYRQHFKSVSMGNIRRQSSPLADIVNEANKRRGTSVPVRNEPSKHQIKSEWDQYYAWGWAALASGYINTAKRHALTLLAGRPLSPQAWRMMYCAIRGR